MDSSISDLSAVDSTAKLLQDLHLAGRSRPAKCMDTTDVELLLEVPYTPDRLATMRPAEDACEEAAREACHLSVSNLSLRGEKCSSSNAFDKDSSFRKGRLASLMSNPCNAELYHVKKKFPFGMTYPTGRRSGRRRMARDLHGENEATCSDCLKGMVSSSSRQIGRTHNGIANCLELCDGAHGAEGTISSQVSEHCSTGGFGEPSCNDDRVSLTRDSEPITEKAASKPYPRGLERRRVVHDGIVPPTNIKNNFHSVNQESSSSCVGRSVLDKGKGTDLSNNLQNKSERTLFQPCQFDIPRKNPGLKRLLRKECTHPLNVAQNRNLMDRKKDGIGAMGIDEVQDGFLSPQLHTVSPDREPSQADEMKEKVLLNDVIHANGQDDAKSSFMSSRKLLLPGREAIISAKTIADIQPADEFGWRTTHSRVGKATLFSSLETSVVSNRNNDSFQSSNPQHGSNPSQFQGSSERKFELDPDIETHYEAERFTRGKRKSTSSRSLPGECSSSAFTEVDALHPPLSGETSIAKTMRGCNSQCHDVTLEPIIDVDELPSPAFRSTSVHNRNCISSESIARDQQVESDEMLARQLQEQFFNESSNFGGSEEMDAAIAWTLQQDEDAQHVSSVRRSRPIPAIAHLYRQYPRQSSHDSSVRSTNRGHITPSARIAQLQRNVRREMDLETRLDFLGALEVAFNNRDDLRSDIRLVQRDFNENDYEMLLALDEDNHQHMGVPPHQIDSLPQTVVQTENVEEACAICLEKPSIGDEIRHLPCLHKFHKDCIDTWLRRRTSCPICKSNIT